MFHAQQDQQNRTMEMVLSQRALAASQPSQPSDTSLVILPDRRELLLAPIGSFDTMTGSPNPRGLGQANSNPTIVEPQLASVEKNNLPQNYIIREDKVVSYREVENNLFLYSADRDWLRNNKENRYSFTVNFDPAANGQSFGPTLAAQQKFKNIVRIELIKAIVPGESLEVSINRTNQTASPDTNYQDNILNMPYIMVRVAELENNNYGTDNFLDRSFGVLQYDAQWRCWCGREFVLGFSMVQWTSSNHYQRTGGYPPLDLSPYTFTPLLYQGPYSHSHLLNPPSQLISHPHR
jgi:hypothetical protein